MVNMGASLRPSTRETFLFALFAGTAFINYSMYLENADKTIRDLTSQISDSAHLLQSSSTLHLDPSSSATEPKVMIATSNHDAQQQPAAAAAAAVAAAAPEEVSIRNWGCNLMETPLIFVHIGKSGGGTVRARLAASALNYTRAAKAWTMDKLDKSYYPVGGSGGAGGPLDNSNNHHDKRGFFCDKGHPQFRATPGQGQEKTLFCHAITPLGQSIACPEPLTWTHGQCKRCDPISDQCPVVYTGKSLFSFLRMGLSGIISAYCTRYS
jgi:hypothetical protein